MKTHNSEDFIPKKTNQRSKRPTISVGNFEKKKKVPGIDIVVTVTDSESSHSSRSSSHRYKSEVISEKGSKSEKGSQHCTARDYLMAKKPDFLREEIPMLS